MGFAVPMHVREYELFYILDGELAVVGPEGGQETSRGDCVKVPCGIPHGLRKAADALACGRDSDAWRSGHGDVPPLRPCWPGRVQRQVRKRSH
jgi:Cupin domain